MNPQKFARCHGLTLIELMISVLIGSLVLATATGLFQTSAKTRKTVSSMAEMQQEAFFVSHTIRQQLSQAGYRGIHFAVARGGQMPIASREQTFPAVPGVWQRGQLIAATGNSIFYRFDGASRADGSADGSIYDCLGNALAFGIPYEAQISLQGNRLVCTVGTTTQILAGAGAGLRIEQLSLTLGVDTDGDDAVDQLVAAAAATASDQINTRHVTVRLLLASQDNAITHHQTYRYNGADIVATDKRLRTEVVVSVGIRNK